MRSAWSNTPHNELEIVNRAGTLVLGRNIRPANNYTKAGDDAVFDEDFKLEERTMHPLCFRVGRRLVSVNISML